MLFSPGPFLFKLRYMSFLPFSQVPEMNSLFLDYMDDPVRVREFYPARDQFRSPDLPHRSQLCQILRRQNLVFGNPNADALLNKLARPDTFCTVTGQQVGLLTGPMYTIWKALSVIQFSRQMESEKGLSCIPIFWMATEDHNWHEIMHFSLLKEDFELMQFSLKEHLFLRRQPTGAVPTTNEEVRKILLRAFREISIPEVKNFYSTGSLAEAFARTLLWLLKDFPILILDPSDPEIKTLAAPFFSRFFGEKDRLLDLLSRQNETLRQRNYPVQVSMERNQLPLFSLDGQDRSHVVNDGAAAAIRPEKLSPSALLRPLFQDFLLPTIAYFGGPAEIAYFAQLHPWYEAMNIQQPWVLPRASLSLVPARTRKFLKSKNLRPEELFLKEESLMDALVQSREWDETRAEVKNLNVTFRKHLEIIKSNAEKIDATLKKSVDTADKKMNYQLKKLERKTFLALARKNETLSQQIRKAKNVLYPDDRLQERSLNIFSFASRLPYLIAEVYERIDIGAKGHQWIDI